MIFCVQPVVLLSGAALWMEDTADNMLPGHQALYWILFASSLSGLDSLAEKAENGRLILAPRPVEEVFIHV